MKWLLYLNERDLKDKLYICKQGFPSFMRRRLMGILLCLLSLIILFFIDRWLFHVIGDYFIYMAVILLCLTYKLPYFLLNTKAKQITQQVYKDFPLWLSSLEVLIVSNNIPNTLKKSIPTCPDSIKNELISLVEKIEKDPTNQVYYADFLSQYQLPDVSELMLDLYQFNFLNKELIIKEFALLHLRLNEISAMQRRYHYEQQLFFIGAVNSVPLFLLSVYVLLIANMLSTTLMGG